MTELRRSLRSIRQSLCAIAAFYLLNWSLTWFLWADEEEMATRIAVLPVDMTSEWEPKSV